MQKSAAAIRSDIDLRRDGLAIRQIAQLSLADSMVVRHCRPPARLEQIDRLVDWARSEAGWAKKGHQRYFGCKAHVAMSISAPASSVLPA